MFNSNRYTDTNDKIANKEVFDKNKLDLAVFDLVDMGFYNREEIQSCFGFSNLEMDYIMKELKNK